jgi:transposase
MSIVGGFDVHRRQVTFDYLDTDTGRVCRGRIAPACRVVARRWLAERFAGRTDVAFAVEACTGWRFLVEELEHAGIEAWLAEPADTAAARGRKRRAKTDPADAQHLRVLLADGRLPTSWIPPQQVREMRAVLELYKDLRDEHTAWVQRIHAMLFHQGVPGLGTGGVTSPAGRARLESGEGLSPAGHQAVMMALRVLDALDTELDALHRQIRRFANRQPGCAALQTQYGVGPITATAIWAMMGDTRRFSASRQAVRHTGLDVTVYSSDGKRAPGHLAKQGPPLLRWALYEAACLASQPRAGDHDYYATVKDRIDHKRAAISVARKIARRSHHILRELGEQAYAAA